MPPLHVVVVALTITLSLPLLAVATAGHSHGTTAADYSRTPRRNDLTLTLTKVSQLDSPLAKCLDGSPPAYYWRDGVGEFGASRAVLFLEGGGWCYPSDVRQRTGANCAVRATKPLGSSNSYGDTIQSTGYEGGSGFLSGDPALTRWSDWAVSYVKYCDGGSMTGTRLEPHNGLYYRGHYNLIAQLDDMVSTKGLGNMKEIVLSGCSAGGMACYLKCDFVASYFARHGIPMKCICDAGMFLDLETVTGAGNVMRTRYHDIATVMESKPGLSAPCVGNQTGTDDWRQCMFSQYALKHMQTPTFVINSLYNFMEWTVLAPPSPAGQGEFPPDTSIPPPDWQHCFPGNGKLSPETYLRCNATQIMIIQKFRLQFMYALAEAIDPTSPHGVFLDSCPNQHCQTSTGWSLVRVRNVTMADATARWYFDGASSTTSPSSSKSNREKYVYIDDPFPSNPTCGYAYPVTETER